MVFAARVWVSGEWLCRGVYGGRDSHGFPAVGGEEEVDDVVFYLSRALEVVIDHSADGRGAVCDVLVLCLHSGSIAWDGKAWQSIA